MLKHVVEGRN